MKMLLVGSNGQLGWELEKRGKMQGLDIIPLDLPGFDITDRSAVKDAVAGSDVSVVVNAAAFTAVDRAESEPELAYKINSDGPAYLASSCAVSGIPLIHISTDYVFDGARKSDYLETDPVSPIGVYGKSKAAGEAEVRNHLQEYIILRTAWLYGVHGSNFVKTILRLGKEKETLNVVNDQYGCPTYAADLAETVLKIAAKISERGDIVWGTYHYCGKGMTTWHGFAEKIIDLARRHCSLVVKKVVPITTAGYPTPAERPVRSVLDCSLVTKNFGIHLRPWQESLAEMINCLVNTNQQNNYSTT